VNSFFFFIPNSLSKGRLQKIYQEGSFPLSRGDLKGIIKYRWKTARRTGGSGPSGH
jgi:hypothetical protein